VPKLRERIRYRFDNLLARGTSATLIWLAAVTAMAVLASSVLLAIFGVALNGSVQDNWLEDVWQSLLRVLDSGTMAGDVGWGRRILALLVTIFGLLVAGTLIGIIAAGVEDRIAAMRRARSVVIESDHLVVLGASDGLPILLQQLALAGAAGEPRTIVVLADLDPAEFHAAARSANHDRKGVRVVHRWGDPTIPADLALVGLSTARAVIVVSDRQSDVAAVETVLAVGALRGGLDDLTVVVELLQHDTADRLRRAFGSSIRPIVTSEAVARTMAFALRQRGLGQVIDELLDFRGSDLILVQRPELVGATFGALVRGLVNARPIGLQGADGQIVVHPDFDRRVTSDDRLIVIAENRHELDFEASDVRTVATSAPIPFERVEERLVVIGWNDFGAQLLEGWATGATASSQVDVVVDPRVIDPGTVVLPNLGPIAISCTAVDDPIGHAADLDPTTAVFLAMRVREDGADVHTILDVEVLRREFSARGADAPRLVVELGDAAQASLIELTGPDDLIISDAMRGQFLAQLVEQPTRREVLLELYSEHDAVLQLVPCESFGLAGHRVVRDIVGRLADDGLIMIGWRSAADGEGGVTLNPSLGSSVDLHPDDRVIVVG